eukprot:scaffold4545_cov111-Isochrysis_galbana.AAC.11
MTHASSRLRAWWSRRAISAASRRCCSRFQTWTSTGRAEKQSSHAPRSVAQNRDAVAGPASQTEQRRGRRRPHSTRSDEAPGAFARAASAARHHTTSSSEGLVAHQLARERLYGPIKSRVSTRATSIQRGAPGLCRKTLGCGAAQRDHAAQGVQG